jgi:Branched-chain amino acid transport protein (AzlD)
VIATATSVGVLVALVITTLLLKGTGPMALGGRRPPEWAMSVVSLVAPAIVSSLVVYETFSRTPSGVTVDERVVGLLAACGAIYARLPMTAVIVVAAASTALARLVL